MYRPLSCLIAIGILLSYQAIAQQGTARAFVYSDIALGIGEPMGFRATANCLFLKHHEIGLGYNAYWHRAPDVPSGANLNSSSAPSLTTYPQETVSGLALTYAYVFYPKKNPDQLRYLIRAGVLLGQRSHPHNFREINGLWKYWDFDRSQETATAFIFQPTINITPTKAFGLTAGAYLLLQKDMSGGGLFLGLQIGKVGNHFRYHSPEVLAASRARKEKKMFWRKKKR